MKQEVPQNNSRGTERCRNCGTPIVRQLASRKFAFLKYQHGQQLKTVVEHNGDELKAYCEKCGQPITFGVKEISRGLTYVVALPKKPAVNTE